MPFYREEQKLELHTVLKKHQYFDPDTVLKSTRDDLPEINPCYLSDDFIKNELFRIWVTREISPESLRETPVRRVLKEGVVKFKNGGGILPLVISVQHDFYKKARGIFEPEISRNYIEIPGIYKGLGIPEEYRDNEFPIVKCKVTLLGSNQARKVAKAINNSELSDGKKAFQGNVIIWDSKEMMKNYSLKPSYTNF